MSQTQKQRQIQQTPNRILIPTTQLSILEYLTRQHPLNVYEISACGSFSGVQTTQQFQYGITFTGVLTGRADMQMKAGAVINSVSLPELLSSLRNLTSVADAVISSITFYERVVVHDRNNIMHFQLKFEKGNIHPQVFGSLVVDGSIPLGETYEVLKDLKDSLTNLPKEFRKHWKPGYLILTDILGHTGQMYDVNVVFSILQQRFPNSLLVSEAIRNWDLKDYQSVLGLRRVRAR